MLKDCYKVLGLMSGTSLDGLDIIEVEFWHDENWHFSIHNAETIPYPQKWIDILQDLTSRDMDSLHEIDTAYTRYLADQINLFRNRNLLNDVDFVSSHGHTALHQPQNNLTYQIGNLPEIADLTGLTVICDFRTQDVALKGQGAPLVPVGDHLLFGDYDYCLNLGGFSNVSFMHKAKRIAFDISPVNTVLNHYAQKIGLQYDKGGKRSAEGKLHHGLLASLNDLNYYQKPWPKSLGIEWVNTSVIPLIDSYNLETADALRTFVEHIAVQIGNAIDSQSKVLVTGGGAYNSFLMERCRLYSKADMKVPEPELVEYKEALIFGFLGLLRIRGEVNCLSSVTGAVKDHSSGEVYLPKIAFP